MKRTRQSTIGDASAVKKRTIAHSTFEKWKRELKTVTWLEREHCREHYWPKNTLRFNLRALYFQKFPGVACPQTALEGLCYSVCHQLMAMQFYKWPIKFSFDWPFCLTNNFHLYCTLYIYIYIYVCMYVCMYVRMYTYIHRYTYIHIYH